MIHFADPIIDILRLGEKRARALKKKALPGSHCACFGPHHGTRCPQVGMAVNAQLWESYVQAQGVILERMRSGPGKLHALGRAYPAATFPNATQPNNHHIRGYSPRRR